MNRNMYRLVYSRVHHMLVAVAESAMTSGKAGDCDVVCRERHPQACGSPALALRAMAFAALVVFGILPVWSFAQIVAGGTHAPNVISTPNGLPQVNVNRPSGAGVSMNTYSQFDVNQKGAIVNNSPTITSTQLAGQINGNPNYAAGQSARIIVNQVNSANPSQLNGFVEVAGQRATVVLANPSGISVNGGGFINTSRAVLTTGVPQFDTNGALTGYNVTGGSIAVQGAGFNGSNIDQVDLIARAVQVNATIYANSLNVIAGANSVSHDTLAATAIAGNGAPSPVSIDVSQLGGMYAGKILLASNEHGVGVSNAGVIAAQAGDFTLNADGRVTLTGRTTASGNVALNSNTGITNSGTTYAQGALTANTAGDLTNNVSLGLNNPLGLNDIFNVSANQDLSFGNKSLGSHGFNGSYSVPWGYWTATLSGNTNTYYQPIAGTGGDVFVSSGNQQTAALRLARVISRSQNDVSGAYFQLSKRFGDSFIDDTTVPTQSRNNTFVELGLTNRHYFGESQFDGTLAYRQGIGGFGATADPYSEGPTYRFHMAVLDANLSVPFAIGSQRFAYVGTVHGQFTDNTLFYIDDLTIGSRYTVRGFDGNTMLAGERGFYWRNELQWPIFQTGQALYAGIDYGHVFGPGTTLQPGTQLAGAVIGIRGGVPAKWVGFSYDLFAGTPVYKPAGFPTARFTVGAQATAQF